MSEAPQPFPGPRGPIPTEDRLAVVDLITRYAHIFDSGSNEGLGDLFCVDAVVEGNPVRPGGLFPAHGRDTIVKNVTGVRDAQTDLRRRHMINSPSLTLRDKNTIGSIAWFILVHTVPKAPSFVVTSGIYEDMAVREADGQWRIKHRIIHRDDR